MQLDSVVKLLTDSRLISLTTLMLVVLLAYQVSLLVWQLVPVPDVDNRVAPTPVETTQSRPSGLTLQQKTMQIAGKHLFGMVKKESKMVEPQPVQDAPESSLKYKLRGIYYSSDESLASVILEKDSNNTNFYHLGDEIDKQIYIKQIQPDHIIISRQGRLEKLLLEQPVANMKVAAISRSHAVSRSSNFSSKVLQSYKRRYANNPLALAKRFQAIPVTKNGKSIGYKLKALRGESLLKKLNLQENDVFVAINGIGLDKPFQALDALKSLTTAENVSLTLMRNGNRETLDFNLE